MKNDYYEGDLSPDLILDSKHILATSKSLYDIKLVDCGDIIQCYIYNHIKERTCKEDNDFDLKKIDVTIDCSLEEQKPKPVNFENEIRLSSINRTKFQCQRLAKANMKYWKTFITLTFAENITDVKSAMKRFKYFTDKVRRVKKDFRYICITEFQKRGAIHFHLLTNIEYTDRKLLFVQQDNNKFIHIKYWLDGFTSVECLNSDEKKVIGYISKYMTKDIDNRLFSKHRYFYSRGNLYKPRSNFINTYNDKDREFYIKKIQDKQLVYQNEYLNKYDKTPVTFLEFSSRQ